jgi:diguanylate cyclase (GGDEF)-like protein
MNDKPILEILNLCHAIEVSGVQLYLKLAELAKDPGLRSLWAEMAEEETAHIGFWNRMIAQAKQKKLPQMFDHPEAILRDLKEMLARTNALLNDRNLDASGPDAFLLAFRVEFLMINPAFETLFQMASLMDPIAENPQDGYDTHLNHIVQAARANSIITPELDLLGEVILKLWSENRRLTIQNRTDPLTGVLNRRGFFESIRPLSFLAQRNRSNVGMLMVDLDHFKRVNDRFGHPTGDRLLQQVAFTLKRSLRASDLVARYGGEEFIVFLPSIDRDATFEVAENVRKRIAIESPAIVPITVSVGAAQGSVEQDADLAVDEMIRRADESLYHAKAAGRDRVEVRDMNLQVEQCAQC